jgi:hypothetical protein
MLPNPRGKRSEPAEHIYRCSLEKPVPSPSAHLPAPPVATGRNYADFPRQWQRVGRTPAKIRACRFGPFRSRK